MVRKNKKNKKKILLTYFTVTKQNLTAYSNYILVFHGIDTVSKISLNGQYLGATNNMFIRYRYNIKNQLKLVNYNIPTTYREGFCFQF